MWSAERFLKEAWCIDGECFYVGVKVIDGINFAIYNLYDSERGSFYVGISSKNKENQKELLVNDLDFTKIPRDRFKSNYYKGEVREDEDENKIWTAKLYFKNHEDYNTFLNWWCGVEKSFPNAPPDEPTVKVCDNVDIMKSGIRLAIDYFQDIGIILIHGDETPESLTEDILKVSKPSQMGIKGDKNEVKKCNRTDINDNPTEQHISMAKLIWCEQHKTWHRTYWGV